MFVGLPHLHLRIRTSHALQSHVPIATASKFLPADGGTHGPGTVADFSQHLAIPHHHGQTSTFVENLQERFSSHTHVEFLHPLKIFIDDDDDDDDDDDTLYYSTVHHITSHYITLHHFTLHTFLPSFLPSFIPSYLH